MTLIPDDFIKKPHVTSFRRFFNLDLLEAGKRYKDFPQEGLKRIFSQLFPVQFSRIEHGKNKASLLYETDIADFAVLPNGAGNIEVLLTLKTRRRQGVKSPWVKNDEQFVLCTIPNLDERGVFHIKNKIGDWSLKCPIGQIRKAPGLFRTVTDENISYRFNPHWGKRLEIVCKLPREERKGSIQLVSSGVKREKIALHDFLDYLAKSGKAAQGSVREFLQQYIAPANSLLYDLSPLGRRNINRILGRNSNNMLLEIDDLLAVFDLILKVHATELSVFKEDKQITDDLQSLRKQCSKVTSGRRSTAESYLFDPYHLASKRVNLVGDFMEKIMRTHVVKILRDLPLSEHDYLKGKAKPFKPCLCLGSLATRLDAFFKNGSMVQHLNRCNPLTDLSHRRKLTFFSEEKGRALKTAVGLRDAHYSMFARVCPLETPQGPVTGLNVSLAMFADVDDMGQLLAPYIQKGKRSAQYYDAAFDEATVIAARESDAEARQGEKEILRNCGDKARFSSLVPNQAFGLAASLIPFVDHDDGPRAMMGISMMKQSLPLSEPEMPLIRTGSEGLVARESGWCVHAKSAGTVLEATPESIRIGSDGYPLTMFEATPQKTLFRQTPIVGVGDKVKKAQLIASGTGTYNGEIALGRNLLAAFMFYKGLNYEDAIIISESASRKLTSLRAVEIICDVMQDEVLGNEVNGEIIEYLSEDGVIRSGAHVSHRTMLVGKSRRVSKDLRIGSARLADKISKQLRTNGGVVDTSLRTPENVSGTVVSIKKQDVLKGLQPPKNEQKERLTLTIHIGVLSELPARVGDKLANRHGNKGVISKILPDDQMPTMPDGTPIEIILNPLGVISRMNVGQLMEMHLGWYARELPARSLAVPQFGAPADILTMMKRGFSKAGINKAGKSILTDGARGQQFFLPVTVGYLHVMKLNHMSSDKVNVRSLDLYSQFLQQPFQGKRTISDRTLHGGQRLGEMEVWALEAYNTPELLREMLTLKSDDHIGKNILLNKLRKNDTSPVESYLPHTLKQAAAILKGLCFDISEIREDGALSELFDIRQTREIQKLRIALMSYEDITGTATKIHPRDGMVRKEDLERHDYFGFDHDFRCRCGLRKSDSWTKRGLCMQCGTQMTRRRNDSNFRMGYFELPVPVPHPFFEKDVRDVLGMSLDAFLMQNYDFEEQIWNIVNNAKRMIEECEKQRTNGQLSKKEMPALEARIAALERVADGKSIFLKYLSVIPLSCRFSTEGREHPLAKSYGKIIKATNHYIQFQKHQAPKGILADQYRTLCRTVRNHFEMLADALKGKEGLIRRDLLGKRVDFSGRIVVVPEQSLTMDQCMLPVDFLARLFRYPVTHKLIKGGELSSFSDSDFEDYLFQHGESSQFLTLVKDAIGNNVILLNRFPTLHRMNIQAFYPVPSTEKNIMKIPVTICAGFNADFDGDQFSIHLPISSVAQKEARERLLPSRNIISPASGLYTPVSLNKDITAGLYWLTINSDKEEAVIEFESFEKAMEHGGSENVIYHQGITFPDGSGGRVVTTVGRLIFNLLRESDAADFINDAIDQGKLDAVLSAYGSKHALAKVNAFIEKIKDIGFRCATLAGLSISYFDLPTLTKTMAHQIYAAAGDSEQLNKVKKSVEENLFSGLSAKADDNLGIIIKSGAGKKNSFFQISGLRGRMAKPDGSEVEYPILSNFRTGLTPLEYYVSCHGARKGSVDKAISTTKSGYLMRKIVEALHQIRLDGHEQVCIPSRGLPKESLIGNKGKKKGQVLIPLEKRIYLRYAAEDIVDGAGHILVKRGSLIDRPALAAITEAGISSIHIMSPVFCGCTKDRICYKCYGNDFLTQARVEKGFAAGIVAAQSVSEPCTQLAMRVFHKGGTAGDDITGGFGTLLRIFEARNASVFIQLADAYKRVKGELFDAIEKDSLFLLCMLEMIDEIQRIFISEGVFVDDRHIEVILREVARDGEFVGIRKAAGMREGFLSKISFEGIERTLVETSKAETVDHLTGLKEKILVGKAMD